MTTSMSAALRWGTHPTSCRSSPPAISNQPSNHPSNQPTPPSHQVFNEDRKQVNGLLLVHLPDGPTAQFRLSNLVLGVDIKVGGWVGSPLGVGAASWEARGKQLCASWFRACRLRLSCRQYLATTPPPPSSHRATRAPPATAPSWC